MFVRCAFVFVRVWFGEVVDSFFLFVFVFFFILVSLCCLIHFATLLFLLVFPYVFFPGFLLFFGVCVSVCCFSCGFFGLWIVGLLVSAG